MQLANQIAVIMTSIRKTYSTIFLFFLILSIVELCSAQPSGGPYGPLDKTYTLDNIQGKVYYAAPDGDQNTSGEKLTKPTTFGKAIKNAITGDAIVLRGGEYRIGGFVFNQGITILPYQDEKPVFKGTFIARDWKPLRQNLWVTKWEHLFDSLPAGWWQRHREGMYTPMHKFNNDMVFVDGKFLQSAGWEGEVNEESFYINYEKGEVYIGIDPTDKLVEITAFNSALKRTTGECYGRPSDKRGPTIKGITFTQYAFRAIEIDGTDPEKISAEWEHGKDVIGTTIENCEISYCSRVAAYLRGDSLTVRNCKVSHTSTEGLFILSSNDVLLERNIFAQNNIEQITGYYPAAVKIFNQCYRVVCNDNLVINHPYSNGIWYDVGNVDGVFTNNWLQNVGIQDRFFNRKSLWPGENAFFFEISKGAVVAGNVFVDCEHGITSLNSCDVEIYNNTFINSNVCVGRDSRSAQGDHFGWHPASGPDVDKRDGHILVNNLFTGRNGFHRPFVYVWQPSDLCTKVKNPPLSRMENNAYILENKRKDIPLLLYSPYSNDKCQIAFNSPQEFSLEFNQFEKNSSIDIKPLRGIFKSVELENYQLIGKTNYVATEKIPDAVAKALDKTKKTLFSIGAYSEIE